MEVPRGEVADYTLRLRMAGIPGRILLVKPSALGDVCRSMPILASLRAAFPAAKIDWLVQDDFEAAVRGHPAVRQVVVFPRRAWKRWWMPGVVSQVRRFRGVLRGAGYDLVVDAQGLLRSGLFMHFTGAARRVGWKDAREWSWLAANERHVRRGGPDATEVMLALLEDAGIAPVRDARMHVHEDAMQAWRVRRAAMGIGDRYLALAPTSRWSSKRWPAARWRALAERLVVRGETVLMLGAPSEREQVRACMPRHGAIDLCGALPLGEWFAALAGTAAVVANDSAAVHAAAALGRPLVGIYGATDPAAVGPYQRAESVVAPPGVAPRDPHAYRDARLVQRMELIPVEAVERRLDQELSRGPRW
jgi:lipopolysaccharide heptosyltransferase I